MKKSYTELLQVACRVEMMLPSASFKKLGLQRLRGNVEVAGKQPGAAKRTKDNRDLLQERQVVLVKAYAELQVNGSNVHSSA